MMMEIGEIEPIIIVTVSPNGGRAVANTRRLRDFSADADIDVTTHPIARNFVPQFEAMEVDPAEAFGGSGAFRRFLVREVIPSVKKIRNVDPDRLGILGHSAGGTFVIETLLEGDNPFVDFIIGEPGIFLLFDTGDSLLSEAKRNRPLKAQKVFYADSGDTERALPEIITQARFMAQSIADETGTPVVMRTYEDATHTTMVPRLHVDGLLFLYGTGKTFADTMGPLLTPNTEE